MQWHYISVLMTTNVPGHHSLSPREQNRLQRTKQPVHPHKALEPCSSAEGYSGPPLSLCTPTPSFTLTLILDVKQTLVWGFVLCAACAGDALDTAAPCSMVNYLRWDLSAQQIVELTAELMEQTKHVYDQVGSQKFEDVSYENTLKALADVEVSYTGKSRSGSGHGVPEP